MLDIKALGTGCTNCVRLEKLFREVLYENGLGYCSMCRTCQYPNPSTIL